LKNYESKLVGLPKQKREQIIESLVDDYKKEKYKHYLKFFGDKKLPDENMHFSSIKSFLKREINRINKL